MRVCVVYDCLFPYTVGGAERWYRDLSERLVAEGHDVTYLTLRQWGRHERPSVPGVRVVAVGPRMALYTRMGRRRILPPLVFGLGVLVHLLRHRTRYDVVHTASFPYFSMLAAALVRLSAGYRIVVDWHEVWSRDYWRDYLGTAGGSLGWIVQRLCVRLPHQAFCFSRLHATRLRTEGHRGIPDVLPGEYVPSGSPAMSGSAGPWATASSGGAASPRERTKLVVYAGRHIPEKQVPALVDAIALMRERDSGVRALILGDGPERRAVLERIVAHRLSGAVEAPGFVPTDEVAHALRQADCLVLPSRREGYGRVVVEAAAAGTPSVVVAGPDNAAVELVTGGVNGAVADSAAPADLAAAMFEVLAAGPALRDSTSRWFEENCDRFSLSRSLEIALAAYAPAA